VSQHMTGGVDVDDHSDYDAIPWFDPDADDD
jgi:hypothetical protein